MTFPRISQAAIDAAHEAGNDAASEYYRSAPKEYDPQIDEWYDTHPRPRNPFKGRTRLAIAWKKGFRSFYDTCRT